MKVLQRYLVSEFAKAIGVVAAVLSLVVVARVFVDLLGRVAKGKIPVDVLVPLLGLGAVRSLVVLLPLALLLALMLVLGRMYRDNEITVLRASGLGQLELFRPLLPLIFGYVLLLALLSLQVSPWMARQAAVMADQAKQRLDLKHIVAGQFQESPLGNWVVHVERADPKSAAVENVFIHSAEGARTLIETATHGQQVVDPRNGQQALILNEGYRYEGEPGAADFRIVAFKRHITRLPNWEAASDLLGPEETSTAALLRSRSPAHAAELQWRLSTPVTALLLSFLAFPLSHTAPRQGRYAKLGLAIAVYFVYLNLVLASMSWVEQGSLPSWIGVWWTHLVVLAIALGLVSREIHLGWRSKRGTAKRHASA